MPRKAKAPGMSHAEYARRRGVTPQAVRNALKSGRITAKNGKIDPAQADADWARNSDPAKRATPGPKPMDHANGHSDYAKVRTALTATRLRRENAALDEALKKTVRIDEARKIITEFIRTFRDGLLNFPNRYGQQIAAEIGVKPAALTAALDKFVREHLTEVANTKIPRLLDG